jgi:iduronate 2-sulfatase|eukprot:COSAG01_NODE_6943_length_3429_cov_3.730030_4_plen_103_part_00
MCSHAFLNASAVEAVSLFPTLVDLAQLPPLPRCPPPSPISDRVKLCADGLSLAPLLLHGDSELSAEHAALANGTLPAYSQWAGGHAMGFTMRTDRFRYTECE